MFRDNSAKPSQMNSSLFNTLMTIASDSKIQEDLEEVEKKQNQVNVDTVEILEKIEYLTSLIQSFSKNTNSSMLSIPDMHEGLRPNNVRFSTLSNASRFYYQ